jgi:hypothetical protein
MEATMPDPLADARATLLDPARVDCHPLMIYAAWARLKAARGQPVARPDLLIPRHVIVPAAQAQTLVTTLGQHCESAKAMVRRMVAEGRVTPTRPFGGDAA